MSTNDTDEFQLHYNVKEPNLPNDFPVNLNDNPNDFTDTAMNLHVLPMIP